MNIALFSSSPLSLPLLEKLNIDFSVKLVLTSPDKPVGRKQEMTSSPLKVWAEKNGVECFTPATLKTHIGVDPRHNPLLSAISKIDLAIIIDYGLLIPKVVYTAPKLQTINIHFSLLPLYRGRHPDAFAILNGEKKTGISYILIDEGFDTGDILAQQEEEIKPFETPDILHQRLYKEVVKNISYIINSWAKWKTSKNSKQITDNSKQLTVYLPPKKQDHRLATYTKRLGREDGYISWKILTDILKSQTVDFEELPELITKYIFCHCEERSDEAISKTDRMRLPRPFGARNDAKLIFNFFRALSPWPGVWTMVRVKDQDLRLKLIQCHLEEEKFVIDQVQLEGKNPVSWKQFCEAYKV